MPDIGTDDMGGPKVDRRTTMKLFSAAGMGGITSLAGCTGSSDEGANGEDDSDDSGGDGGSEASTGGSIEAGWSLDELEVLDPHYVDLWKQIQVFSNVFSGLVKLNSEGEIVGDVAADWTLPDDRTYEFEIREGITFHNGDTLDAEACKWSIDRLRNLDDSPHKGKVEPIESVEAPDATTLIITLEEPYSPFLSFLTRGPGRAGTIVNKTAVEEDPEAYRRFPVGSGPFKVTDRETGENLVLEAFDDYWETDEEGNSLPYLDEITINLIPEPSTMWTAAKTGEIDYAEKLPAQNAKTVGSGDGLQVTGANAGEFSCLSQLCNDPADPEWQEKQTLASGNEEPTDYWEDKELVTSDPTVRKAIAKGIDRKDIVQKAHFGFAEPAHGVANMTIGFAYEEEPDHGQYHDPEGARELLDEAGYTGDPRFTIRLLGSPTDERVMTVVQQQLADIGIEVELDIQQESSFWDSMYRYEHELQMYGGGGDIDPWMSWWKQLKTPAEDGSGVWQKSLYSNEAFDELLEESVKTPDAADRAEIVGEAERIMLDDAPFAMTTFPLTPKGGNADLKGVGNHVGLSNFHSAHLE